MNTSREAGSVAAGRKRWARAAQVLLWWLIPAGAVLAQTPPFQETTTLSSDADAIESDFSIPQSGAGQYKITLTDLGALLPDPPAGPGKAPLDSVHVVITRDTTVVATLDGNKDKTVAVSTQLFDATPGTYKAHIAGKAGTDPGSGPVGVRIASVASSTSVLDLAGTLVASETARTDLRTYQADIDVPADGDYAMTLADLQFPRAGTLETAGAFLLQAGSPSLAACLSIPAVPTVCPSTQTVHLTAGHYQFVVAGALQAGADAGVFAVHIASVTTGAALHSRRIELGSVKRVSDTSFQLTAGSHTLSLKDLLFPASLSAGSVMIATSAQSAAIVDLATTTEKTFTVPASNTTYDVFTYATPDATAAAGSYIVEVKPTSGPADMSVVQAIGDPSGNPVAYTFPVDLAAGGTYRTKFGDFQFPAALSGSRIAVVQNGVLAGKTDPTASSTLSLDTTLAVGRATIIVLAKSAQVSGGLTQTGGTFGLEMGLVGGTQSVFEATQGIGGLVSVRKISITSAGRYDITVTDLNAPAAFNDLMMVVSRGSQRLGILVVGSAGGNSQGGVATLPDFDASLGNYSITLIAVPNATGHASTYGISMAASPPAPTVTLTATPGTVTSGATAGLSWSSQGATSCVASSTPAGLWSGTKATSGTDASGAITAATTFTLRCTDSAGRSTEKTATVSVQAQNNTGGGGGGGGGAVDWLTLAALTLGAGVHLADRRRPRSRAR